MSMGSAKKQTKTRKFVADGVFYAELNELLARILGPDGYGGVEIRVTPIRTEVILSVTRVREVLGTEGRRIAELNSLVQKRFGFKENTIHLFLANVKNRGLCAMAQAESLRFKLDLGLPARKACHNVINFVMRAGATGCEVIVSGKLRAQRAKVMKFRDGYLISTGDPKRHYIQEAVRHLKMRQGMLGVKVRIMLMHDPTGKNGGSMVPMPDKITYMEAEKEKDVVMMNQEGEGEELDEVADGVADGVAAEGDYQEYKPEPEQDYQPAAAGGDNADW